MTTTLFWRALLAFLAMPGIVALAMPIAWLSIHGILGTPRSYAGLLLLGFGIIGLVWCCVDFYREGKGTLAPWDPPRHLVRTGLYRFSRNPMYVSVVTMLLGWTIAYMECPLGFYAFCIATAFHLRVVFGEEPFLERTFREEWREYRAKIPRWI